MGLLAVVSLLAIGFAFVLPVAAAVLSARRLYQVPLYWVCSALFAVVLPWIWHPLRPSSGGGEYGALAYLAELGFSWSSLFLILGALLAFRLAGSESNLVASLSGLSWGLVLVAFLRLVLIAV